MKRQLKIPLVVTIDLNDAPNFDIEDHIAGKYRIAADAEKLAEEVKQKVSSLYLVNREGDPYVNLELSPEEKRILNIQQEKENELYFANLDKMEERAGLAGIKYAYYSMPFCLQDKVIYDGPVKFLYDNGMKAKGESDTYYSLTYFDALKVFDKAITITGDYHHIFLEDLLFVKDKEGIRYYRFLTGS